MPNLVDDSSFEGNAADTWTTTPGGFATTVATAHHGTKVGVYTHSGTGNGFLFTHADKSPAVTAGQPYTASAYLRHGGVVRNCRLDIIWLDAARAQVGSQQGPSTPLTASLVRFVTANATAPVNATAARIRIVHLSPAAGNTFEVDAVQLEPGTTATAYAPKETEAKTGTHTGTSTSTGSVGGLPARTGTFTGTSTSSGTIAGEKAGGEAPAGTGTWVGTSTSSGTVAGTVATVGSHTGVSTSVGDVKGAAARYGAWAGQSTSSGAHPGPVQPVDATAWTGRAVVTSRTGHALTDDTDGHAHATTATGRADLP